MTTMNGLRRGGRLPLLQGMFVLLLLAPMAVRPGAAVAAAAGPAWGACLDCHEEDGLSADHGDGREDLPGGDGR